MISNINNASSLTKRAKAFERMKRREIVADCMERGFGLDASYKAVRAAGYKCGRTTIFNDQKTIIEKYERHFVRTRQTIVARQANEIRRVRQLANEVFERSRTDEVTITKKTYTDDDGNERVEITERRRPQAGSIAALQTLLGAWDRERKVYNLEEVRVTHELGFTPEVMGKLMEMAEGDGKSKIIDSNAIETQYIELTGNGSDIGDDDGE